MTFWQEGVWGDVKNIHINHIKISQKISKLSKELWEDEEIPKELKLEFSYSTWRAWGGPENTSGIQVLRLPWCNIAITNTGDVISLTQLDDIIDAVNISNEELAKSVDQLREEFEKNPTTNDKAVGPIISYYKDASQKLIAAANPKEEDCKK